jgi:hypothetical protein
VRGDLRQAAVEVLDHRDPVADLVVEHDQGALQPVVDVDPLV